MSLGNGRVAKAALLGVAALGLLIGALARSEEQAIIFSLVPMFILAGLGGAWVPVEGQRMDAVLVADAGRVTCRKLRDVKRGDKHALLEAHRQEEQGHAKPND